MTVSAKDRVNNALTNEDITAQALLFFIAGFDTTSSLMCFTIYELTVNQDVQERLRKEIHSTWKECCGNLTYEDLLQMKYLDMVISGWCCLKKKHLSLFIFCSIHVPICFTFSRISQEMANQHSIGQSLHQTLHH